MRKKVIIIAALERDHSVYEPGVCHFAVVFLDYQVNRILELALKKCDLDVPRVVL
jgi:hypothetical protein